MTTISFPTSSPVNLKWWQRGVIYQIYPRSFQDSNGDGIGDLRGIEQRLDHCESLGVDALWLSPIFPSPMADFGYDVADYCGIDPMFGTLEDFDRLMGEVKRRGLKLILDFVPNHTSDAHSWFLESRLDRGSAKRDWYLWRDPKPDGGPPNNWLSHFGGSAWQWDPATGQYYYHAFLKEQPDLNWRNPAVVAAMHDVLRFWLARGADGFRVDVLWHLIKDERWRDNPPNPDYGPGMPPYQSQLALYSADRPEIMAIVSGLRRVVDEYADRVLIGEIYLPVERLVAYYGAHLDGVHLPFNFQLLLTDWDARGIAALIDRYEAALPPGGWPNWVLGNHDKSRIASRIGPRQARVAVLLLLTLRGTPTLYCGDELGMLDGIIAPDQVQDPYEKNVPGIGVGRDPCRTPMQWDSSPGAGFSSGIPWLPVSKDFDVVNVEAESADPGSMLTFHRTLLKLRKAHAALSVGEYQPCTAGGDVLAYWRLARNEPSGRDERWLIALNLGGGEGQLALAPPWLWGRIVLSTHGDRVAEIVGGTLRGTLRLRPHEGVMVAMSP